MTLAQRSNWKILLFFIYFYAAFSLEPILMLGKAEGSDAMLSTIRYLAICLLLGVGLLSAFIIFLHRIFNLAASVALCGSAFTLKLCFYPIFYNLSVVLFFVIFIGITLFIYLYLRSIMHKFGVHIFLYFFVALITAVSVWSTLRDDYGDRNKKITSELVDLELKTKPNIYVFSYDSLIPRNIAEKYLNIDNLPYQSVVDRDFSEIDRSLSFLVPTKPSINDLMRLGQKDEQLSYLQFAGRSESVLQQLLWRNDYNLVTGFTGTYLGTKGPFVDIGIFPEDTILTDSVLCLSSQRVERLQLMLACEISKKLKKRELRWLRSILFGVKEESIPISAEDWHDKKLNLIREFGANDKPHLTYLYTYNPIGHTPNSFHYNDLDAAHRYVQNFIKRAEVLAMQFRELVENVRIHDPSAILLVMGDHGPFLSRQMRMVEDPEFFYQDRHRVLIAVARTDNECAYPENWSIDSPYGTPSLVLSNIFLCLSSRSSQSVDGLLFYSDVDVEKFAL